MPAIRASWVLLKAFTTLWYEFIRHSDRTVAGDKTWYHDYKPESKYKSMQGHKKGVNTFAADIIWPAAFKS